MCMFRDLKASEIECRVGQANENGLSLLLYKDARVDMAILDETVGQARWQREHYEVKGNLYCRVGIKIDNEWIWKADCGTESNTEAEKGESSDSFKRSCVNWGIGRELYTAPFIWIKAADCNLKAMQGQNGKTRYACYDTFSVTEITIKDKVITELSIRNDKTGKIVYTFGKRQNNIPPTTPPAPPAPSVPFPEAEKPKQAITPEELSKSREWAVAYIVESGPRQGMKLGDVRKLDKASYVNLRNNPPSVECARAIQIIDEWVGQ